MEIGKFIDRALTREVAQEVGISADELRAQSRLAAVIHGREWPPRDTRAVIEYKLLQLRKEAGS